MNSNQAKSRKEVKEMLSCQGVNLSYGEHLVLKDVSLSVFRGERIGLVGANGIGKSTLLKVLAGKISPNEGRVQRGHGAVVGYMPQEFTKAEQEQTVGQFLAISTGETEEFFSRLDLDPKILDQPIATLSGGEKSKVALLFLLLQSCDVYLLDEPTNNLDLSALLFLEEFIQSSASAFVLVSHDRKLLDNVVDRIVEIDEFTHSLHFYEGGFTSYLEQKTARVLRQWETYRDHEDQVKRLEQSVVEKKKWANKAEKGPRKTDNEKLLRKGQKDWSKGLNQAATSLENRLERLGKVERPKERLPIVFSLTGAERSGNIVLDLQDVEKQVGDRVIGPFSMTIHYGQRIVIVGPNGSGKTTFLELLAGKSTPNRGALRIGTNVKIGYLPQQPIRDENVTVLQHVKNYGSMNETEIRKALNRFGITKEQIKRKLSELSPGQRSRLVLATLEVEHANLLLLDEPSNHLDLDCLTSLEEALKAFRGTMVIVSHDRYFLDKIEPQQTFAMSPDGKLEKYTDYEDYERMVLKK